jgi:hypothetical protein
MREEEQDMEEWEAKRGERGMRMGGKAVKEKGSKGYSNAYEGHLPRTVQAEANTTIQIPLHQPVSQSRLLPCQSFPVQYSREL